MRTLAVPAIWIASILLVILVDHSAWAVTAHTAFIDSVELTKAIDAFELHLQFAEPVRYLRHAPLESGNALRIHFEPLSRRLETLDSPRGANVVRIPVSPDHPVESVYVDRERNGSTVVDIRFKRTVRFEVLAGQDLRSLRVRLPIDAAARQISRRSESTLPLASADRLDELMHEGRVAMTAEDYDRASLILGQIARMPENPDSADALEMLGLARERKKQWAHARAEYQEYLRRYPDGEGADRVRQRLAALNTARAGPSRAFRPAPEDPRRQSWDSFGSIYVGYRRESLFFREGEQEIDSSLYSDVFLDVRRRRGVSTLRGRFSGSTRYDFLDDRDGLEGEIYEMSFSGRDDEASFSWSTGRMRRSDSGVLGRFDGVQLGYRMSERWGIGFVAGIPVDSPDIGVHEFGRALAGISLDLQSGSEKVDGQIYAIGRSDGGLIERAAVGAELHFFDDGRMLGAFLDYDIYFQSLNVAQLLASWQLSPDLFLSALVDHRTAPILTLQNALIGQPADDLGELRDLFSNKELRRLAEDRTARATTATLNASYRLTPRLQIAADISLAHLSGTEDSGGVDGFPGTDPELSYVGRMIASDLVMSGDTVVGSLGYFDGNNASSISARLDARFPLTRNLRFNPRCWIDFRMSDGGDDLLRAVPSLRFDYRWRSLTFETESGFEWELPSSSSDQPRTGYFLMLGVRHDF